VDPAHVKDKDGVSALLLLCDIAARAKAEGRTLTDLLDDIAARHGLHATDQLSARVADLSEIPAAMARLRESPPLTLGGLDVLAVDDLGLGSDLLPPTDGLRYRLADGARVIVRPSGTEPKIKCYLEVVVPVEPEAAPGTPAGTGVTSTSTSADGHRDAVDAARIAASGRLDALRNDIKAAAGL
jgi:phosphomannomutase